MNISSQLKEYKWNTYSDNHKAIYLIQECKQYCMSCLHKLPLDDATKLECILEAIRLVVLETKNEDNYKHIKEARRRIKQIAYYQCTHILDSITSLKRGGMNNDWSLEQDTKEYPTYDTNLLDVETALYIEQLKPTLTETENKFIATVLNEPHILSNREYASLLDVNENTIRRVKHSLQNKIRS